MKLRYDILAVGFLSFLVAGCGVNRDFKITPPPQDPPKASAPQQDLIVLLPEADGKVGEIRVENAGGSVVLNKPWQTARVENYQKAATSPQTLDGKEVTDVFKAALDAQPDLSRRFSSFTLWFESDKTKLTDSSKAMLPEILTSIKSRKSNEIHIVGHTDRVGAGAHNLKLSARRANYVRDLLYSGGIKAGAFVVSFQGEAMPLVYTEDEVPEPLNRRVEVFIR